MPSRIIVDRTKVCAVGSGGESPAIIGEMRIGFFRIGVTEFYEGKIYRVDVHHEEWEKLAKRFKKV